MGDFLRLSVQAFAGETPPTEFKLLSAGANQYWKEGMPADGGTIHFDNESAAAVLERFEKSGRKKIAIDYDHSTSNPLIQRKLAAGWFVPAIRDGELWATEVSWTKRAAKHISEKEYLYYSPTVEVTKERKVMNLRPAAITNDPALFNTRPLIAASAQSTGEKQMKVVLTALGLEESADEAAALAALQPLKDFKAQILQLSGKATLAEAVGIFTAMKAQADKVESLNAQIATLTADKEKVEVDGLLDEAIRDGRITPAKRDEFAGLVKAAGVTGLKTCLSALPRAAAPAVEKKEDKPTETKVQPDAELSKVLKATGLTAEKFAAHEAKYRAALNPKEEV